MIDLSSDLVIILNNITLIDSAVNTESSNSVSSLSFNNYCTDPETTVQASTSAVAVEVLLKILLFRKLDDIIFHK